MLDDIESANNYDPFILGRYSRWLDELQELDSNSLPNAYALMNIGLVETLSKEKTEEIVFTEVDNGLHTYLSQCAEFVSDGQEALAMLEGEGFNLQGMVILEGIKRLEMDNCDQIQKVSTTQGDEYVREVESPNPNQTAYDLKSPLNAWFVVAEAWYPGWNAYIDGKPTPIYRANYLFRAIMVPAGAHQVIFIYEPVSFQLGIFTTLISLIVMGGVIIYLVKSQNGYRKKEVTL